MKMSYTPMRNLYLIIIVSFYFAQIMYVFAGGEKYSVYIANDLPDNDYLVIHVFSGDDDLKYHNLTFHEYFRWDFKMAAFDKTKFYGHFWWQKKHKERGFAVFDYDIAWRYCGQFLDYNICWWSVKEDGFWIANMTAPAPEDQTYINWWLNKTSALR
jgi:hypothetical protein